MIEIKRGDTGIGLKATLSNEHGHVNLTGADVLFLFDEHEIVGEIHDAENGIVNVIFERTHTNKVGVFNAEFEVRFADGRIETFPNDDYLRIKIMQDLGGL